MEQSHSLLSSHSQKYSLGANTLLDYDEGGLAEEAIRYAEFLKGYTGSSPARDELFDIVLTLLRFLPPVLRTRCQSGLTKVMRSNCSSPSIHNDPLGWGSNHEVPTTWQGWGVLSHDGGHQERPCLLTWRRATVHGLLRVRHNIQRSCPPVAAWSKVLCKQTEIIPRGIWIPSWCSQEPPTWTSIVSISRLCALPCWHGYYQFLLWTRLLHQPEHRSSKLLNPSSLWEGLWSLWRLLKAALWAILWHRQALCRRLPYPNQRRQIQTMAKKHPMARDATSSIIAVTARTFDQGKSQPSVKHNSQRGRCSAMGRSPLCTSPLRSMSSPSRSPTVLKHQIGNRDLLPFGQQGYQAQWPAKQEGLEIKVSHSCLYWLILLHD